MRTLILVLLLSTTTWAAEPLTFTLKVVDLHGDPVDKAEVAFVWNVKGSDMKQFVTNSVFTDAKGLVTMTPDEWHLGRPLLVLTQDRRQGAFQTITAKDQGKTITVQLKPTVRLKGKHFCKELGIRPSWSNTMLQPDGAKVDFNLVQQMGEEAQFDFILPIGKYKLDMYGTEVEHTLREITLTDSQSVFDLGTIDMTPNIITKLKGKPAPELTITDARGVPKTVQLSDYKGKWVYLEFWGYWWEPCYERAIPALMAFEELHKKSRDQYVILSIHDHSVKTLAELDTKLIPLQQSIWQGRDIPFPILLDGDHATSTAYGITGRQIGILIDPEGNLVGKSFPEELAKKLPPLPASVVWKAERDQTRNSVGSNRGDDRSTLNVFIWWMNLDLPIKTELDEAALKRVGISPDKPMPWHLHGGPITYRNLEALLLTPLGLGIIAGDKGERLLITTKTNDEPLPKFYEARAKQLNDQLDGDTERTFTPFTLTNRPLAEAIELIEGHFRLPLAIDAKAIIDGTIDPQAKVSGSLDPKHLRRDLTALITPLKLKVEVKHETIVLTPSKEN